jgi:CRISPR type III-A-associated protein Csm2
MGRFVESGETFMNDRTSRSGGQRDRGDRPSPQDQRAPAPSISPEEIQKILEHHPEDLDKSARNIAQQCQGLERTQIRNFYGPVVRLRSDLAGVASEPLQLRHARDLFMHSARLAYMAARNGKAKPLENCFTQLVRAAVKNNRIEDAKLRAICDFAEAVVAYHYSLSKQEKV